MGSTFLHPRPFRAWAEPQAGVIPPRRNPPCISIYSLKVGQGCIRIKSSDKHHVGRQCPAFLFFRFFTVLGKIYARTVLCVYFEIHVNLPCLWFRISITYTSSKFDRTNTSLKCWETFELTVFVILHLFPLHLRARSSTLRPSTARITSSAKQLFL